MSEREAEETIKVYSGADVGASQCLVTLEGFIGDMENAELADDSTVDASEAVIAINGLIWSLEQRDAELTRLRALIAEMRVALEPFAEIHEPTHQITTIKADHIIAARAARDKATVNSSRFWQPIETAPKDGRVVLLLSKGDWLEDAYRAPRVAMGKWNAEGDSWVDQYGQLGGDAYELAVTGVWDSEGGWFQPNEVTHWGELPSPPETARTALEKKA